tara:strand:- start:1318 stop:1641 length:324 start_codon:yes stop_codon:yes gene_type:complete
MNQISSAVAYLHSTESKVMPKSFKTLAAQVKADIKSNIFGDMLTFPVPRKTEKRSNNFDPVKRGKTVHAVNELRRQGQRINEACGVIDVPVSSYQHWAMLLGIEFIK